MVKTVEANGCLPSKKWERSIFLWDGRMEPFFWGLGEGKRVVLWAHKFLVGGEEPLDILAFPWVVQV